MKRKFGMLATVALTVIVGLPSMAQQSSSGKAKAGNAASSKSSVSTADADTLFMKRALAIGVAEIEFAQVALQNSNSEKVKDFAQKMIEDHTNANNKLQAIMDGTAVPENPAMSADSTGTSMGAGTGTGTGTGMGETSNADSSAAGSNTGISADSSAAASSSSDSSVAATVAPTPQPAKPATTMKLSGAYLETKNKMEGLTGAAFDRQYVQQAVKDHNLSIKLLEKYQAEGSNAQLKSWVKEQLPHIRQHKATASKLSASTGASSK